MKKKVAMCLCLGMVIGLMTGATAQADDEVKLTFWKSPHSDREDEIWASMIAEFNKEYPNISVEFLNVAWDSVVEKETAALQPAADRMSAFRQNSFRCTRKMDI